MCVVAVWLPCGCSVVAMWLHSVGDPPEGSTPPPQTCQPLPLASTRVVPSPASYHWFSVPIVPEMACNARTLHAGWGWPLSEGGRRGCRVQQNAFFFHVQCIFWCTTAFSTNV